MDRRGFVKAMGMTGFAFVVSPYIPRDPGWDLIPTTWDIARQAFEKLQDARPSEWVFVMHPDLYAEIKDLYTDGILH